MRRDRRHGPQLTEEQAAAIRARLRGRPGPSAQDLADAAASYPEDVARRPSPDADPVPAPAPVPPWPEWLDTPPGPDADRVEHNADAAGDGDDEPTAEAPTGDAVLPTDALRAAAPETLAGFTSVPHYLVDSGIVGALERAGRCLGWLLVVLIRQAERRDRVVTASWRTLCVAAGIGKRETLARHLRRLTKPWPTTVDGTPVTIPALLMRRRGAVGGGRRPSVWAFRPDGLAALGQVARNLLTAQARRRDEIKDARARAGRTGMARRWGRADNKIAAPGTFVTKPLRTKAADNKSARTAERHNKTAPYGGIRHNKTAPTGAG